MAIKTVTYIASCPVSCYSEVPAEVILCVPSSKVQSPDCPEGGEDPPVQPFEYPYIEGTLTSVIKEGTCNGCLYKHVIQYDDAQLAEDETIYATDISGIICKDCLTSWIEAKIGNEPYFIDNEDGTWTFVSPHGCEYIIGTPT